MSPRKAPSPARAGIARQRGVKHDGGASAGVVLTLELSEPPSINAMLGMAKRKTRRGPHGRAWLATPQSEYWVRQQEYRDEVGMAVTFANTRAYPPTLPAVPWRRWRIVSAHFRLHQLRDPLELAAGLKWAADALVSLRIVDDDGPDYLAPPPAPTQEVDRKHRGVTLTIQPITPTPETPA